MKLLPYLFLTVLPVFAQQPTVPDGYYTLGPFPRTSQNILYTYDTDATRAPYGNANDYEHPAGRNGESAYLYATEGNKVLMANTIYHFQQNNDGTYTIQSCSGEAHTFLGKASYDRHLVYHTALPQKGFRLQSYEPGTTPDFSPTEYILQPYSTTAFCDSLACETNLYTSLNVLQPVDSIRLTPAFVVRPSLGYARGVMATYPSGTNPGQVPETCSASLSALIEEASSAIANKDLTQEQSDELILALREAADTYLSTAPQNVLPVEEGYYFLRSAYKAFLLRQGKEKVAFWGDDGLMRWGDQVSNDGSQVFHLQPLREGAFRMLNYQDVPLCSKEGTDTLVHDVEGICEDVLFENDGEGMWRIALASNPQTHLFADKNSTGQRAVFGKNSSDVLIASNEYLFPGYCASWYVEKAFHEVTFPSHGWAGLSTSFPVEVPEGVEVYSLNVGEDGMLCTVPYREKVIPASSAVILKGPKGTCILPSTCEEVAPIKDNALQLCQTGLTGIPKGSIALLRVKEGKPGFTKSTSSSLAAGNIYIPFQEGMDDFRPLDLERFADGILTPNEARPGTEDNILYDLSGKRISQPRDIYIQNHKKKIKL